MSSSSSTLLPSSSSSSLKPKRTRGPFNKAHLADIELARDVLAAANQTAYRAILRDQRDVTDADLAALGADIAEAEALVAAAHSGTIAVRALTDEETAAKKATIAAMGPIQRGAIRTFRNANPERMKDYFVGENLDTNLIRLKTIADAVLGRLEPRPNPTPGGPALPPLDVLKGVKTADIATLRSARDLFEAKDDAQQSAQHSATGKRRTLDEVVADLNDERIDVMLAADQQWPWNGDPAVVTTPRADFQLPDSRPLTE